MTTKEYIQLVDRVVGTKGSLKVPAYWMNRLMKESTKMIEDVVKNIDLSNYPTWDQADENYAFRHEFENLNNYVYNTLAGKVNTNTNNISSLSNRVSDLEEELLYFYPKDATIEGPTNVLYGEDAVYTWKTNTANVTGSFDVSWSSSVTLRDKTQTSCVISNNSYSASYGRFVLTLSLKKKDGTILLTTTKEIALVPANTIITTLTNAPVQAALYSAGLVSNENYTLKSEAEAIQDGQINPTGESTGSIFYNSNIETFNEFKYFTGLTSLDDYAFYKCTVLQELTFPSTMVNFGVSCCKRSSKLPLFIHGLTTIKSISSQSFYNYISSNQLSEKAIITFEEVDWYPIAYKDNIYFVTIKKFNLCSDTGEIYISDKYNKRYVILQELFIKPEVTSLKGNFHCKIGVISGGENVQSVKTTVFGGCDIDSIEPSVPFGLFEGPSYISINGDSFTTNSSYFYENSPKTAMLGECTFGIDDGTFADGTNTKTIVLTHTGGIENLRKHFSDTLEYINIDCNFPNIEFLLTDSENVEASSYQINVVGNGKYLHPRGFVSVLPITEVEGYVKPTRKGYYSSGFSIESLSFEYIERSDIYIQHVDGNLYTSEEWTVGGYSNDNANGVAVVRPFSGNFVIAKEDAGTSLAWSDFKTVTDIVTSGYSSTASIDNAGINNTPKIISQLSGYTDSQNVTGAPAAEACANYMFPNGLTGYLGALGEWNAAYNNKTAITEAMSLIGGTAINTSNYYWTSTQIGKDSSWLFYWHSGDMVDGYFKGSKHYVRAFSAPWSLSINCNMADIEFQVTYTKVRNGGEKTVTVKPGIHTAVLPQLNTTVTISVAPGYEWAEIDVTTQSFTYTGSPMTVTFVAGIESGIYIQHTNGTLYTTTEWTDGGYSNDTANGVAVVDSSCAFTIAKENVGTFLEWGGFTATITGIVTTTVSDVAVLDFDGEGNTTKIIEQLTGYRDASGTTGAPAAEACANYMFPNGSKGYLPSLGEWRVANNNRIAVNEAMSLIGGTAIALNYYWTSTQGSYLYSWTLEWGIGECRDVVKDDIYYVRAFSSL